MTNRCVVIFTLLCFQCCQLFAQTDSLAVSKNRIHYYNNFIIGGLLGKSEQGTGASFSMVHGIRINRLALGGGIAFDAYREWKTVPLFGSLTFDFARIKNSAFFIQMNAGYAKAWDVKKDSFEPVYDELSGKGMLNSMIGYRLLLHRYSIYINAGHKFQRIEYSYNPTPWSSVPGSNTFVEEDINRVVIQVGFGFN
jgi:hypothetical protein